jgi:hypothetical protein
MTKGEETRLQNLSRKQGFRTLTPRELKDLSRLTEKKSEELLASRKMKKGRTTRSVL